MSAETALVAEAGDAHHCVLELGAESVESNPTSFKASLPGELAYWKKVVKDSGAHID